MWTITIFLFVSGFTFEYQIYESDPTECACHTQGQRALEHQSDFLEVHYVCEKN